MSDIFTPPATSTNHPTPPQDEKGSHHRRTTCALTQPQSYAIQPKGTHLHPSDHPELAISRPPHFQAVFQGLRAVMVMVSAATTISPRHI
ncbi:hypothetical protein [Kutzneria sp. CA-103260]|uniref:hypothetical protein n=1 Tax=Kutzneria sp. CA-103260 TaxID=2802641 RepID=UPI001BAE1C53|nr:hypothetical protein [Kutzneria sp. CA-103260]